MMPSVLLVLSSQDDPALRAAARAVVATRADEVRVVPSQLATGSVASTSTAFPPAGPREPDEPLWGDPAYGQRRCAQGVPQYEAPGERLPAS
jgi:hypothetical protein